MKAVLFTHIDLDGYGARIMVQKWAPDIIVRHVDYGFDALPENRKLMAEADLIIFTDISVSRETAELLEQTRKTGKKLLLLDHHQSAYDNLHDLGYDWIHIDQSKSGALLAYEWFRDLNPIALRGYEDLAKYVSDYDLWEHKYPESKMLQFLWSRDSDYFTQRFLENPEVKFSDEEMGIINESLKNLEDSYQEAIGSLSIHKDNDNLNFGLIKSIGLLSSLVADRIMKENPSIDYLVIMNKKGSLSLRSLHYEVRKIAEALGGGGHFLAAGCPTEPNMDVIESIKQRRVVLYDIKGFLAKGISTPDASL